MDLEPLFWLSALCMSFISILYYGWQKQYHSAPQKCLTDQVMNCCCPQMISLFSKTLGIHYVQSIEIESFCEPLRSNILKIEYTYFAKVDVIFVVWLILHFNSNVQQLLIRNLSVFQQLNNTFVIIPAEVIVSHCLICLRSCCVLFAQMPGDGDQITHTHVNTVSSLPW